LFDIVKLIKHLEKDNIHFPEKDNCNKIPQIELNPPLCNQYLRPEINIYHKIAHHNTKSFSRHVFPRAAGTGVVKGESGIFNYT